MWASRAGHVCSNMATGAFVKAVQFLLLFHKSYAHMRSEQEVVV